MEKPENWNNLKPVVRAGNGEVMVNLYQISFSSNDGSRWRRLGSYSSGWGNTPGLGRTTPALCCRPNTSSPKCPNSNSWILWIPSLTCQRDFAYVIKLRILRWGDYPGVSNVITAALIKGRQEATCWRKQRERCDNTSLGFEAGRCRQPLEAGKTRHLILPRASGRSPPCWYHDFSLVKLLSDFWLPEL